MASVVYSRHVYAFGILAGYIENDAGGGHLAYDTDWSPIGGQWSTERRAAHAIDQYALQALYPPTVDVLLDELRRGLVCLDQDPANLNRLARCDEVQIRRISARLLERRWSKQDLVQLIATWRELREMGAHNA